jgi:aldose 1-epimerase
LTDPDHPVFNAIVGRYANRIKNGTFSIPITKTAQPAGPGVYQIPTNDHGGEVTLHGGIIGWDRRNWTVVDSATSSSVTYKHIDDGDEGFPGKVEVFTTHEVSNGGVLRTSVRATASEKTPIMVTQHVYWNLDAFKDGQTTVLNYQAQIDASRVVRLDGDAIPTGQFLDLNATANKDALFDFRKPRTIGKFWNQTVGLCGGACQGYDHAWIYDHDETKRSGTSLYSPSSGIRLDIATNQPSVQMYTAYWVNTPRKVVHGGPKLNYTSWSGVAVEQQGWVDAINTPEWNVDQIYGPGRDFDWSTTYKFSVVH